MTLDKFINQFFDETWFKVTDTDGTEHFFWNADYIGSYEPTVEELLPLLPRQINPEVTVCVKKSPEDPKRRVPMVCIELIGGGR